MIVTTLGPWISLAVWKQNWALQKRHLIYGKYSSMYIMFCFPIWFLWYCVLVWDVCKHITQSKFFAWVHYSVLVFSVNLLIISLFNECSGAMLILNVMAISIITNVASWLVRVFISYSVNLALDFHCSDTQQHLWSLIFCPNEQCSCLQWLFVSIELSISSLILVMARWKYIYLIF
jgi:hypothetical protein